MTLPVETSTMSRDFVQWIRAELALAPLAPGDYIVRLSAKKGGEQAVTLAAFRVVP